MSGLRTLWGRLVDGLWFVPSLIVVAAIALAVGMVELSAVVSTSSLAHYPRIFGASAEGSRSMLSSIASSMITVAGVTFSITMVAVTQASSQYTPRILRNFMRDRPNQIVLGVFVGIFAYCLVVLRTIRGGDEGGFVPSLAVLMGMLLAIVGIAVLIYFVHHIASTLQASEIVSRIHRDTARAVDRLYPAELGEEEPEDRGAATLASVPEGAWRAVGTRSTGYLQHVDGKGLLELAREREWVIRIERRLGEFVTRGSVLAAVAPHPDAGDRQLAPEDVRAVAPRFTVATYRTVEQDAAFGVRQLVDIALKALSPSSNDTTTAVTCLDYLGALLELMVTRRVETAYRSDEGRVHVVAPGPTFGELLDAAFDEIRRSAAGNVTVLARQLELLELLVTRSGSPRRRGELLDQIARVEEVSRRTVAAPADRARLEALTTRARAAAAVTAPRRAPRPHEPAPAAPRSGR